MLKRNVDVGEDFPFRHERDHLVHVGIRINVVEPHPHTQFPECRRQIAHARLERPPAPEIRAVLEIHAVGARVLGYHQQLLHARFHQGFRLPHHLADRPAHQIAAQGRDDAERAAVIAALGDLQVGVVPRSELDALGRHEVGKRIMRFRQMLVHRRHDFLQRVRAGDGKDFRVCLPHDVALGAETAGDDDAAVFLERLADRVQRFLHRRLDEPAGVDDYEIGPVVRRRNRVALRAQPREDAFGIDQSFGTTERDESDLRCRGHALD